MDHSHHSSASGMDMGHDHGDMPGMQPMCSMNMLFTWDTTNLCIVFRGWRVTDTTSLILSLLAVMALTAGYEAVRDATRRYESRQVRLLESVPHDDADADDVHIESEQSRAYSSRVWIFAGNALAAEERKGRTIKAALYGVQVFYSFFIMLLFMTYNGWIMLAVGFGAFFGHLLFGGGPAEKSAACH